MTRSTAPCEPVGNRYIECIDTATPEEAVMTAGTPIADTFAEDTGIADGSKFLVRDEGTLFLLDGPGFVRHYEGARRAEEQIGEVWLVPASRFTAPAIPVRFSTSCTPFDSDDYADATVTVTAEYPTGERENVFTFGYRIDGRS